MALNIAIVDFGMGNINSVYKKLYHLDLLPVIVTNPDEILKADKLILPGVGHFEQAISKLKCLGFYDVLNEAVLIKKTPILGICLGMQLMANASEEGRATGFGWINTQVIKFKVQDNIKYKVPQVGWNTLKIWQESSLLKNLDSNNEFYFLHSYHYADVDKEYILATTEYDHEFISVVQKENVFGTQFHPEKSHDAGSQLLKNFTLV